MVTDYSNNNYKNLSSAEQERARNGLCPECGNSDFTVKPDIMSRSMSAITGIPADDFINCDNCGYVLGSSWFKPRN